MLKHVELSSSMTQGGKRSAAETPDTSPDTQQQQQPSLTIQGAARRRRKANFSAEEVDILVREVTSRRHVLFGIGQNGRSDVGNAAVKATEKLAAWRAVAACVNSANRGESRTVREIRKKWENVTSTFRKRQLGDLGSTIELEPHILAGGRCPSDEVLACARAYQSNRMMHQQRKNATSVSPAFLENFHVDESGNRARDEYTSSEDDLILDIQPDVHIESLETPLTFTDSDDVNSRHDNSRLNDVHKVEAGTHDSSEGEGNSVRYHGNKQLLQLQQQLRSGEVIISPALHHGDEQNGVSETSTRAGRTPPPGTSTSATSTTPHPNHAIVRRQKNIEEEKLAVMKQLLKVETKRLKVERKRLKIEKLRLRMIQND